MNKLTADEIIEEIKKSRPGYDEWGYEEAENWEDLETLGLSKEYQDKLGDIRVVFNTRANDWDDNFKIVWHFRNHDVYIEAEISDGSYGVGYKIDTWTLREVHPKTIQVTIYE